MKPSVTIDERGVVLHVTNDAGEGVAIPLSMQTVAEIVAATAVLKAKMLSPAGRVQALKAVVAAFLEVTKP